MGYNMENVLSAPTSANRIINSPACSGLENNWREKTQGVDIDETLLTVPLLNLSHSESSTAPCRSHVTDGGGLPETQLSPHSL